MTVDLSKLDSLLNLTEAEKASPDSEGVRGRKASKLLLAKGWTLKRVSKRSFPIWVSPAGKTVEGTAVEIILKTF